MDFNEIIRDAFKGSAIPGFDDTVPGLTKYVPTKKSITPGHCRQCGIKIPYEPKLAAQGVWQQGYCEPCLTDDGDE